MLHVHRAERADRLVAALADVLAEPLGDPLATEVVAVPSRGIERWIAQQLASRLGAGDLGTDGVCANLDFPFPARLVRAAVAAGSCIDPDDDPWLPERLTWPLLSIVDANPAADMLGPLRTHVGGANPADDPDDDGLARRLGAVRHVADLFDRYGVHRPGMITRWWDGEDVGPDGRPVPARHAWQPRLWREVRRRIDTESFAERRATAIERIRDEPELLDLPPRLAMFGLTALPATFLEVVAAIGAHRDLQLLLLHPSRDLWDRVAAHATADAAPTTDAAQVLPLRDHDTTAELVRNPLLASWGRDVRELQLIAPLPRAADLTHHDGETLPNDRDPTLLQRLQADVRADRHPGAPTDPDRPRLAADDTSVQLHDCHGRLRQVEVLRDAILHLLAERDGLEPRDVIVMCPDIETFAPLVTAVFGAAAVVDEHADPDTVPTDAPPALRVRLADRSLRRTNPVLEVVSQLLDLVDGRVTASDVVDLVARDPIRRRFAFTEDDIDTIETWVGDLHVKWGFDADHRAAQGLPRLDAHTWHAGCQRLLLGAAMADEDLRLVEGVAPYDGVEGTASALAGRFVELLARLEDGLAELAAPRPVAGWRDAIAAVAGRLTDTDGDQVWQRLQLHRVLDDLVDEASTGGAPSEVDLTLAEVRTTLADRLAGRPSSTSHRTGDLTFSTLVPMRSVPHRVVCLLGLDDQAFPRQVVRDDDDLLGLAPRVGDRDPRSEDRQLLLDALMAATETLVVTYAGRHERTNDDRPPAVPVDELRDAIDRTVTVDEDRPRDHVTTRHPLAEHDPRNFTTDVTTDAAIRSTARPRGAWGFDPAVLEAARAGLGTPEPPAPFLVDPLPPPDTDVVELGHLVDFLVHPVKAFIRQRLGFTVPTDDEPDSDSIPSTLRGLEGWAVGDQLLQAWLDDDADPARVLEVLRAKGMIPPGDLATDDLDTIEHRVGRIVALCERCGVAPGGRRSVDVEVELPDGRSLVGDVPDVDTTQHQLLSISYSSVAPKHRLRTWARWLALLAQYPGDWTAITAGRHSFWRRKNDAQAFLLNEPSRGHDAAAFATRNLQVLLDLYDRGMREPLPLYCATSQKIADNARRDRAPDSYLSDEWTSSPHSPVPKEDVDPHHQLVLGGVVAPADLFAEPCRDDERDWGLGTPRVVTYAQRLWDPVLDTERRCEQK